MKSTWMVKSGDVELAVYRWGEEATQERPIVVLVHGYPDSASVWNACAEQLKQHYDVYAYDVRGAGKSTLPKHKSDYALEHLVDDFSRVLDAISPERAVHVVAHDWGSIQSWESVTAEHLQHRIASYTSISGPCLDHVGYWIRQRLSGRSVRELAELARQSAHSWYIALFHLPAVGPAFWRTVGAKYWPLALAKIEGIDKAEPNATQEADGVHGVNLYRANILDRVLHPSERRTNIPVHLICPSNDHFMVKEIWDDLPQWAPNLWRSNVDAGHWVQVSHPEMLAEQIRPFVDFVHAGARDETPRLQAARVRSCPNSKKSDVGVGIPVEV